MDLAATEQLGTVVADESKLTQVIVNLLVNAAQAFTTADVTRNRVTVRLRRHDRMILEVTDNGSGIDPAIRSRIFDPFFTTKAPSDGKGLGLSIAHGIVRSLGGDLECDSEPGVGSTFRISLPVAAPAAPAPAPVAKRGRVLVVDDERIILTTMRRMLQAEFEVVTVEDPREALAKIEGGERFDVMFSDISMSHLSGMELYRAVAAIQPELAKCMVFISGDLSREDIREFINSIPNERIEKPFNVQEIRALVRRLVAA